MGDNGSDDDLDETPTKARNKSRRELPSGAVATLKAWLLSPEHFTHPYPTPQDQAMLMQKTGIDKKQLKNWFTNARRRIWKPMLKKQLEQGKLQATGAGGGGVAIPGVVTGLMVPGLHGAIAQPPVTQPGQPQVSQRNYQHDQEQMRVNYQQAIQQANTGQPQEQQQQISPFGQHPFIQQQPQPQQDAAGAASRTTYYNHQAPQQPQQQQQQQQLPPHHGSAPPQQEMVISAPSGTMSSGAAMQQQAAQQGTLSKADSHAVLMELFARDQDLVREAAAKRAMGGDQSDQTTYGSMQTGQSSSSAPPQQPESRGLAGSNNENAPDANAAQSSSYLPGGMQGHQLSHPPVKSSPSQGRLAPVPTLNSWPHFSSISSLNNLGTMPGVKSITSLSGADLANQGPVNRVGNLAQVKSQESMGKTDSFAFLEVLFDRSGSSNALGGFGAPSSVPMKREKEEDNDVGLSLEDEGPSTTSPRHDPIHKMGGSAAPSFLPSSSAASSTSSSAVAKTEAMGGLKRSYDATLAARGLLAVSRSSEKLTDLVLPAKIQRTLSQEFMRHDSQQQQQQQQQQQARTNDGYRPFDHSSGVAMGSAPSPAPANSSATSEQQPGDQQLQTGDSPQQVSSTAQASNSDAMIKQEDDSGSAKSNSKIQVPTATKCALCHQTNVDTQLRPCGHMFHERCLKPSLQSCTGAPKCPVDHICIQSALIAVPCDEAQTVVGHAMNVAPALPTSLSSTWNQPAPLTANIKSES